MDNGGSLSRKAVVAGRWKLLADALRGRPIHRRAEFEGYDMISSRTIQTDDSEESDHELVEKLRKQLKILHVCFSNKVAQSAELQLVDELETSLLNLLALSSNIHETFRSCRTESFELLVKISNAGDVTFRLKQLDFFFVTNELCRRCCFDVCTVELESSAPLTMSTEQLLSSVRLRVYVETCDKNRYLIRQYNLETPVSSYPLLIRERSADQVISLEELTSHHRDHEIDNTGNVCVWDCEKSLLWALLKTSQQKFDRVVELGAGMAGLVALGLAASKRTSHVVVTDGNAGSLQSNRSHLRLAEISPTSRFECSFETLLLPWALEAAEEGTAFRDLKQRPVDLAVVSDCTHFERYHGHLLWTLIQSTVVGGQIWMCHPNRGRTLERFLEIVRLLVSPETLRTASTPTPTSTWDPLLTLEEKTFAEINEKHQRFEKENPHYRSDVHRPRFFSMVKLRKATETDRLLIIDHVSFRGT